MSLSNRKVFLIAKFRSLMNIRNEKKILVTLIALGFILHFVTSTVGYFFQLNSLPQIVFWQISDSMGIMACVLTSRYMGSSSEGIASAGYVLMGIALGISFGSTAVSGINEEKLSTLFLPLVPAIFLTSFCSLYPLWLRISSLIVCIPFLLLYKNVIQGIYSMDDITYLFAYLGIQILALFWSFYIYKDYKAKSKDLSPT